MHRCNATESQNLTLSIFEIAGGPSCVASDDGQKVYDRIAAALKEGRSVTVSFADVMSLTPTFLNAAIGQLYGSFTEKQIRSMLKVQDAQPNDLALLKRVVETAKQYFRNPQRFQQAAREALEEDGDEE